MHQLKTNYFFGTLQPILLCRLLLLKWKKWHRPRIELETLLSVNPSVVVSNVLVRAPSSVLFLIFFCFFSQRCILPCIKAIDFLCSLHVFCFLVVVFSLFSFFIYFFIFFSFFCSFLFFFVHSFHLSVIFLLVNCFSLCNTFQNANASHF